MRITCPTCSTQYEVDEKDISFTGQDVQCSECMTIWTQSRNGEATNPRKADELTDEKSTDNGSEEIAAVADAEIEEEIVSDLNYPDDPENAQEVEEITAVEDTPKDEPIVDTPEEPDEEEPESVDDTTVEDTSDPVEKDEKSEGDDGEEENPIWKEIAALAQEASDDIEQDGAVKPEFSPPDNIPPIQIDPVVPEELELVKNDSEAVERPWEAVADENEGFSDFIWSDPSKDAEDSAVETKAKLDRSDDSNTNVSQFTPLPDTSVDKPEEMNDDLISAALNEQMAIEGELEKTPHREERDIANVSVELGGPRARTPNVEALKQSVRTRNVKLTKEEEKEKVLARRFRRGLSLILLIFVILMAVYVSQDLIVEYLPAAAPYLETYIIYVDILRANAEVFAVNVWDLILLGIDWVKAKISG